MTIPMSVFYALLGFGCFQLAFSYSRIVTAGGNNCRFSLVESIPEGLHYDSESIHFPSTFSTWHSLLQNAQESIHLGVFYWTLKNDTFPSASQGEEIFDGLLELGMKKKLKIRIAQNAPSTVSPQMESFILKEKANAEIQNLDFQQLLGSGILHTKLWIIDNKHVYIGSANMDWRSLTQVKESGILIEDCSDIAEDVDKIFKAYWYIGKFGKIPRHWPSEFETQYNIGFPMIIPNFPFKTSIFLSSSPASFNAKGRTNDIDAILNIINAAEKFIYIAVMDFFPRFLYSKENKYWPDIDNSLRRAAFEREVEIRILGSHWKHTRKDMVGWLKSLEAISSTSYPKINVQCKLFVVPTLTPEQEEIPFARVNHNKYMVTEKIAYIGTSNWSGDYFNSTAGIGVAISQSHLQQENVEKYSTIQWQLKSLFERDWISNYSYSLENF